MTADDTAAAAPPGATDLDAAFYRLTVAQRDHAWIESARHKAERDEARAALAAMTARRGEALDIAARCSSDRLGEISGDCTTYEDAFEKLVIACAALRFIRDTARAALSEPSAGEAQGDG